MNYPNSTLERRIKNGVNRIQESGSRMGHYTSLQLDVKAMLDELVYLEQARITLVRAIAEADPLTYADYLIRRPARPRPLPEPDEDSIERNEIRRRERIAEANEY